MSRFLVHNFFTYCSDSEQNRSQFCLCFFSWVRGKGGGAMLMKGVLHLENSLGSYSEAISHLTEVSLRASGASRKFISFEKGFAWLLRQYT